MSTQIPVIPLIPLPSGDGGQPPPRRTPSQKRSRERVERILTVAAGLIAAEGSDALRMSDVAERAGVSIGSLYQYFPDKAAVIRSLADRFNAYGLECTARDLAGVRDLAGLKEAVGRAVDGYFQMFVELPAMREIWSGTQADKTLQDIDLADIRNHAGLLGDVVSRLRPDVDRARLAASTLALMQALCANVRLAVSLDQEEAEAVLEATKRILAREVEAEFFLDAVNGQSAVRKGRPRPASPGACGPG
jgi:AcrR family transcriptional regulator